MAQITLTVMGMPLAVDTDTLLPRVNEALPQIGNAEYLEIREHIVDMIEKEDARRGLQ